MSSWNSEINWSEYSDDDLISLVRCGDRLRNPPERRFDGDDTELKNFYYKWTSDPSKCGLGVVLYCICREALARGLDIPYGN